MAHEHHQSTKHGSTSKLTERRFTAEPSGRSNVIALVGGLGTLLLGAGVYAQWVRDTPLESAPALLLLGAAGIALSAFMGDPGSAPIRVGNSGVAVERSHEQPDRIFWWEVERVALDAGGSVVVESQAGRRIEASLAHHAAAAAWILKEALSRVPKRVGIDASKQTSILKDAGDGGALVPGEPVQRAGRRCKASGKLITFEDDARLCERCGQVYHREHVPALCLTCDAKI